MRKVRGKFHHINMLIAMMSSSFQEIEVIFIICMLIAMMSSSFQEIEVRFIITCS